MYPSIWKLMPLFNEGKIFHEKIKCNAEHGHGSTSKKKKSVILWKKDFEDKCLGTIHKIKSVICTILP